LLSQQDELSFEEGDLLYITEKNEGGWWKAKCGNKVGLVPSNYGEISSAWCPCNAPGDQVHYCNFLFQTWSPALGILFLNSVLKGTCQGVKTEFILCPTPRI
jgi:hypothetical protein